jgi:hypothetical protein
MRTLLIAVSAGAMLFAAGPVAAQDAYWDDEPYYEDRDGPYDDGPYDDRPYYEDDTPLPRGAEVAAMAPMIDRMAGAVLQLDVAPMLDALDPFNRYGPRGRRTLGELARRDDPDFDRRLRGSIYGTTAAMARMMDAIATATPAMRRSLREMEREIDRAVRDADPYRR